MQLQVNFGRASLIVRASSSSNGVACRRNSWHIGLTVGKLQPSKSQSFYFCVMMNDSGQFCSHRGASVTKQYSTITVVESMVMLRGRKHADAERLKAC